MILKIHQISNMQQANWKLQEAYELLQQADLAHTTIAKTIHITTQQIDYELVNYVFDRC